MRWYELYRTDCQDIYDSGNRSSSVYEILPEGSGTQREQVYCEMDVGTGTGWTVVQRRDSGSISFYRRWLEYQYGFGSLYGEFWLGNDLLHRITRQGRYKLRIDLWDWEGTRGVAEYGEFRVDSDRQKYRLHVRDFSGDVGEQNTLPKVC